MLFADSKRGTVAGQDGIAGDLLRTCPAGLARHFAPMSFKTAVHQQVLGSMALSSHCDKGQGALRHPRVPSVYIAARRHQQGTTQA
eukprot:5881429-Pyramimonas_sp.AAC.1